MECDSGKLNLLQDVGGLGEPDGGLWVVVDGWM